MVSAPMASVGIVGSNGWHRLLVVVIKGICGSGCFDIGSNGGGNGGGGDSDGCAAGWLFPVVDSGCWLKSGDVGRSALPSLDVAVDADGVGCVLSIECTLSSTFTICSFRLHAKGCNVARVAKNSMIRQMQYCQTNSWMRNNRGGSWYVFVKKELNRIRSVAQDLGATNM